MDYRVEIPNIINGEVVLPESKSIMARAMIINSLCFNAKSSAAIIPNVAFSCDDIRVIAGGLTSDSDLIDVDGAGTAMRFLTAYYACQEGRTVTLNGSERMRKRPIAPLVDALRQMGASIEYIGCEGYPPLKIAGRKLHGGSLSIKSDVSSQFISALLMIAPVVGGMTLTLDGEVVSRPYIDMTIALMRHYGIDAEWKCNGRECQIIVPKGKYTAKFLAVEGDWSAASYWFAMEALLPQSRIVLSPLFENSLQGDRAIVGMMEPLGVKARFMENGKLVLLWDNASSAPVYYERDMAATPDLVPTLAVTLCLLRVPFTLMGVRNLRIKESNRLEALKVELAKLGYNVVVEDNSLIYNGNHLEQQSEVEIDPHNDHRIAMAMSLAATRHKIVIKNAEVVTKSYPGWWEALCAENSELD